MNQSLMVYSIRKKTMIWIVYDSLDNPMRRFNSRRAALDYKFTFGNSKWYIYEIHR